MSATPVRWLDGTPDVKDPSAVRDFPLDWAPYLDDDDELADVDVVVYLADQTTEAVADEDNDHLAVVGVPTVSAGDGDRVRYTMLRLGGGVVGLVYAVRHRVTTVDGDVEDRTRWIRIRQQ